MQKFYTKQDVEKLRFYQTPKVLMEREQYRELGLAEKMVYGVLLDRTFLSIQNNWFDEDGYAYILFSGETLGEVLNVHEKTARKYILSLKKFGLLEEKRMGRGMLNRIYLVQPNYIESDVIKEKPSYPQPTTIDIDKKEQKVPSRSNEMSVPEVRKSSTNDTDLNELDFNDFDRSISDEQLEKFINKWTYVSTEMIYLTEELKQQIYYFMYKYGYEDIMESLDRVLESDYLLGRINGLPVKLDWFLKEQNFVKVASGQYKTIKEVEKKTDRKTKFHNFEGRSSNYSESEIEDIARKKREEYIKNLKENKA